MIIDPWARLMMFMTPQMSEKLMPTHAYRAPSRIPLRTSSRISIARHRPPLGGGLVRHWSERSPREAGGSCRRGPRPRDRLRHPPARTRLLPCEPEDVAGLGPRRPRRAIRKTEPEDVAGLGPRCPRRAIRKTEPQDVAGLGPRRPRRAIRKTEPQHVAGAGRAAARPGAGPPACEASDLIMPRRPTRAQFRG